MQTRIESTRDKIMLGVLFVIIILIIYLFYKNFYVVNNNISLLDNQNNLYKQRKVNFQLNYDFLNKENVEDLIKLRGIPLKIHKSGNTNPFIPFKQE